MPRVHTPAVWTARPRNSVILNSAESGAYETTSQRIATLGAATWPNLFRVKRHKPVSQSCAVAKSGKLWRTTGQSSLAYKRLAATKASKVWFSYSHNCTLSNRAIFHSVCQVCLSSGPPEYSTFIYCAWLWTQHSKCLHAYRVDKQTWRTKFGNENEKPNSAVCWWRCSGRVARKVHATLLHFFETGSRLVTICDTLHYANSMRWSS